MNLEEDQVIIKRILNGDINAYAILVNRYKNLVYTLTYRMLKHREEAEEAAQDTFIKTFKYLNNFKGDSKFSTWIYRISYNACLDRIKKNKSNCLTVEINDINSLQIKTIDTALDQLQKKEKYELINTCINLLPSEDGFLLTLFYLKELSLEEISEILKLKTNLIKVRLHRSRKKLAVILNQRLDKETIESYGFKY